MYLFDGVVFNLYNMSTNMLRRVSPTVGPASSNNWTHSLTCSLILDAWTRGTSDLIVNSTTQEPRPV
jgi:hypothetical protein